MDLASYKIQLNPATGGLDIIGTAPPTQDHAINLHPLWLRERVIGADMFDPVNHQRLYEHGELAEDLKITKVISRQNDRLIVEFNSNETFELSLNSTFTELGWRQSPDDLPTPQSWDAKLARLPQADWDTLDDPAILMSVLKDYFVHGFCILQNTPTRKDSLKTLSRRFGYLRETNFGELFNVETKPAPSDLAYTDVALASHTDNPYRDPVPGIQYLHCLTNNVSGGLSTLVDGMKIAQILREESPDQADRLEQIDVRFRYQGPSAILEHHGPIIDRDHHGFIRHIRLSSRVDYVPALELETLSLFYAGRRRLYELSNDTAFQIRFPFRPGTLLMMDNYRLLHGRTAFDAQEGHRHLQGCYIDHDGPASLYRMLVRDGRTLSVKREI